MRSRLFWHQLRGGVEAPHPRPACDQVPHCAQGTHLATWIPTTSSEVLKPKGGDELSKQVQQHGEYPAAHTRNQQRGRPSTFSAVTCGMQQGGREDDLSRLTRMGQSGLRRLFPS